MYTVQQNIYWRPGPVLASGDIAAIKKSFHRRVYPSGKRIQKQISKIHSISVVIYAIKKKWSSEKGGRVLLFKIEEDVLTCWSGVWRKEGNKPCDSLGEVIPDRRKWRRKWSDCIGSIPCTYKIQLRKQKDVEEVDQVKAKVIWKCVGPYYPLVNWLL